MDLTTMTEAEFMCEPDNCGFAGWPPEWDAVRFQIQKNGIGPKIADGPCGYEIYTLGEAPSDVVACDAAGPVGIYLGHVLSVDPAHGHRGVATAMILAAVKYRPKPSSRSVSEAGAAALRRAWRVANS